MNKAVVLFSGGLDSTTCLAHAIKQGFQPYALSFNYGQEHSSELVAAKKIAKILNVEHKIFDLNINQFSTASKQTDTYVPARNTIFLSIALGFAEALKINDIFIGVSTVHDPVFPDCRPEYISTFQMLANQATKLSAEGKSISIHTPLMYLSKAETIKLGIELGVDYSMTVTCYKADLEGKACGQCDSCILRKSGFEDAKVKDPTRYYALQMENFTF